MFARIGSKISGYLDRGMRLGKKVAGHVKRIDTKVLPLAKGILGLAQGLGGGNKHVANFVNIGQKAVGMGDKAVGLSNRVLEHRGVGSSVSTVADQAGRAYKSLVHGGDARQALGLLRDGTRTAGAVRSQVVSQAKSALQKVRRRKK